MILTPARFRMLRWEADIPLLDHQRTALVSLAQEALSPLGDLSFHFDQEGDTLSIQIKHSHFATQVQRDTALWLCIHALMESASVSLEVQGTMFVGQEHILPSDCQADPPREISAWWASASPIPGTDAHRHRGQLQTYVKRRQYPAMAGYISRELRGSQELASLCFGFVPLVLEALWRQHGELGLPALIRALDLAEMARRPREALMTWLESLPPLLRQSPAADPSAPMDRVIASIQADCSLPYSQQNLSRSLGLTPAYFCRLFRARTGQHFSSYLTRVRMEKAQQLIQEGKDMPLQALSSACGYPNKSYFCQVFKKYTGMTPGEFQARQ